MCPSNVLTSSFRRYLSVRHCLASSTAARVSCPGCSSSFTSSRSNNVNASAVAPAQVLADKNLVNTCRGDCA